MGFGRQAAGCCACRFFAHLASQHGFFVELRAWIEYTDIVYAPLRGTPGRQGAAPGHTPAFPQRADRTE
ncbi:MAG: hypothetical protein DBY17_00230 [Oscillospiraceae bacterium]|nr:MAG: hypothetical protein DBY17_00230 [Oscillospiraceae bacterium]